MVTFVRKSVYTNINNEVVIRVISILLLSALAFSSTAQKKKKENANDAKLLSDHAERYEGSILLSDGDELKGLVKYNDRNGVLSYQDGSDVRVFTPLRVSAFEFLDERLQKQRVFYTLTYEDVETSMDRPLFFEVLKEYKNFAILSRANRLMFLIKLITLGGTAIRRVPAVIIV